MLQILFIIPDSNIISPLASIDQIRTNVISPLGNQEIAVKGNLTIKDSNDNTVAQIDTNGNASLSGNLTAQNASISGNLAAQTIKTESLQINADATVAGTLGTNTLVSNSASVSGTLAAGNIRANQLSISGDLSMDTVHATFGIFEQGITSLGPVTATQVTAMDSLAVGDSFTISNNAINTIGADLEIQSLRQGNIAFEGGLIKMDTDGNMNIGGNLSVLGNISASQGIFTDSVKAKALAVGIISPLPDSDLVIKLNDGVSTPSGKLKVQNNNGSEVLSINSRGDLFSSGSASFAKLNFNLVGQAEATSLTEAVATGSAGFATLRQGQPELTIKNSLVTAKSLIYITPFGDPGNKVFYLLRQVPNTEVEDGSFTVGVSGTPTTKDVQFNWLIVN